MSPHSQVENDRAGENSEDSLGVLTGKVVPDTNGDAEEWWDVAQGVQMCFAGEAEPLKKKTKNSSVEKQ